MAENATHTLHNLLTLRGALVRDPRAWAHYLTEAIELFGGPRRRRVRLAPLAHVGPGEIIGFLSTQRDLYAYLHDQTLRLLNRGLTGAEIAEGFRLPPALENAWSARGYYGSVSHNVKAIYQRYMGWFDGNPARLWQHVRRGGGHALRRRRWAASRRCSPRRETAYDDGDFRWAATLLDHAVFADPSQATARELLARTLEQLGYGTENGTWRNFFLSGAAELRGGTFGTPSVASSPDLARQIGVQDLFDALAVRIDGPKAWELDIAIDWTFPDLGHNYRSTLRNGVLTTVREARGPRRRRDGDAWPSPSCRCSSPTRRPRPRPPGPWWRATPRRSRALFSVLAPGDPSFPIVTP